MPRRQRITLPLLVVLLGAIVAGALFSMWRSHAAMLETRRAELGGAARHVASVLSERYEDLELDIALAQDLSATALAPAVPSDAQIEVTRRELMALGRTQQLYVSFLLVDASGRVVLRVDRNRTRLPQNEPEAAVLRSLWRRVRDAPEGKVVFDALYVVGSPALSLRLVATPVRTSGAVRPAGMLVVAVRTDDLFDELGPLLSLPQLRIFVVDPSGRVSGTDRSGVVRSISSTSRGTDRLLRRALASHRADGAVAVEDDGSPWPLSTFGRQISLVERTTVTTASGNTWRIVLVQSTESLQQPYRAALASLGAGWALILLVVGVLGAVVLRQQAREVALRERLLYADALGRSDKLSTVGVLAASVAHEVGTPLGIIRARAEHLAEKSEGQPGMAAGLEVIVQQTERIQQSIRRVLDFSAERVEPARIVDLEEVVREAVALVDHRFRSQRVELSVRALRPATVRGVPDRLQQILVNLLLNACDACSPGDAVSVEVGLDRRDGSPPMVGVRVVDSGCGIETAQVDRIFDPFFTTKPAGEGTGLGLAIASDLTRGHGGRIELDSAKGRGSTFTVWLPDAG